MWYLLAREVLRLRGTIPRSEPWSLPPDMFFYRDPEEVAADADAARGAAAGSAEVAQEAEPQGADWDVGGSGGAGAIEPGLAAGLSAVPGNADQGLDWAADASATPDWAAPDPQNKPFEEVTSGPPAHPSGGADAGWD